MQYCTATTENSEKVPQKIKNRTSTRSGNPTLGIYLQELKSASQSDISTLMFITANSQ
jgi:hypothetical protein